MSVLDEFVPEDDQSLTQPTTYSRYVALVAVAVGIAAVLPAMTGSLPFVTTGGVVLAVGVLRGDRTWLTRGYVLMIGGGLVHGAIGGTAIATVGTVVAATVAWDVAENGIGLVEQVGPDVAVGRAELVHAVAVTLIGVLAGGAAIAVTFVFANNQPLPALVMLLFAVVILVATFRQG